MEHHLFDRVEESGGKRMKFPTRPSCKRNFSSEWVYTSFSELSVASEKVHEAYLGSTFQQFNSSQINVNFKKNMKAKDKYVAEIIVYLPLFFGSRKRIYYPVHVFRMNISHAMNH